MLDHHTERELRALVDLAADATQVGDDSSLTRLTLERADGVRMVDLLDGGFWLVVALRDGPSLGKARFLMRRLRGRVARLLSP